MPIVSTAARKLACCCWMTLLVGCYGGVPLPPNDATSAELRSAPAEEKEGSSSDQISPVMTATTVPTSLPTATRNPFRPPNIPVQPSATRVVHAANIRLLGFAKFGGERIAVLDDEGTVQRVQKGDKVGSWKVVDVLPSAVYLQRESEKLELKLD